MSAQLKLFLTEQVIALYDKAEETGDRTYASMAYELNEVLNGILEIRGKVT